MNFDLLIRTLFFLLLFSTCFSKVEIPIPSFSLNQKCHTKRLPVFQLFPVALSIAIVWSLSHVLTVTDVFPNNSTVIGYKARTDSKLQIITDSPWFSFPLPRTLYNRNIHYPISYKVVQSEILNTHCYWNRFKIVIAYILSLLQKTAICFSSIWESHL
jgi:hypothetical protein